MKDIQGLDTKRIGTGGEYVVTGKLLLSGIDAHRVNEDYYPYDIMACLPGAPDKLIKIQVQTSNEIKDGFVQFDLKKSNTNTKGTKNSSYKESDVDFFALYAVKRDKIYMVPFDKATSSCFRVRFEKAKNGQSTGTHWESEYTIDKFKEAVLSMVA